MRQTVRAILVALTLILACGATAQAETILLTPGLFASGRNFWCVASNFSSTPQSVTTQIIRDGTLLTPDNNSCDAPIQPGLSCFTMVFNPGGGATLCLFAVKNKKVIGTAQILEAGHLITVVPAIRP